MKAISPLVAAVLLIAITLTLAGMVAFWAAALVRGRVADLENQTLEECMQADFSIYSCSYDNATQRMTLVLNNLRSVDLHNITVWIFYPEKIEARPTGRSLPANYYDVYKVENVTAGYTEVAVRTHCPELERRSRCA